MNIPTWQEMIATIVADENRERKYYIPSVHYYVDSETNCEYIRGGSGSYTPRMEYFLGQYRHKGC